jgi:hypothetical protein
LAGWLVGWLVGYVVTGNIRQIIARAYFVMTKPVQIFMPLLMHNKWETIVSEELDYIVTTRN